jgi:lysophospholipase L1-like esterase
MLLGIGLVLLAPLAFAQPVFQPDFNQALRLQVRTTSVATFRMKVPIGRAGDRLRFTFRAGDGPVTIYRANVAFAGSNGALASDPVAIEFNGSESVAGQARERVTSDPVNFPVSFRDELYVSFEVEGALGASIMGALPGSYARFGQYADWVDPFGGTHHPRAVGLATVEVEGEWTRVAVALGDSITEGYVSGAVTTGTRLEDGFFTRTDDYRNAWPAVAGAALGIGFPNAGVSGAGVNELLASLPSEVFPLEGITDCVILIGTNDLAFLPSATIISRIQQISDDLAGFCKVWLGTLVPKERTTYGDYQLVRSRRLEVNEWIRQQGWVIDFEAVLADPNDVHRFLPGLGEDGIHPSIAGQRVMGDEVARVF